MKKLCVIVVFFFFSIGSHSQQAIDRNWYSIKAFVPQWKGTKASLSVDGKQVSSEILGTDIFSYNGILTEPKLAVLSFQRRGGSLFIPLFIERGLIRVRTQTQFNLIPYGTPLNDLYAAINKRFDSLISLQPNRSHQQVKDRKRELAVGFIKGNTTSLISLKFLDDLFYLDRTANDTLYYSLFQSLDAGLKASAVGKKIGEEVSGRFATAVGKRAPIITLPNITNQLQPVYEPGTITLVNFWASWCVPCRKEHPLLKKLAGKYGTDKFAIVSVSLDTNPLLWREAIRKEGLNWKQISDGQGWESKAVKAYGVKSVPANFLLDANGIIIAKDVSLTEMEAALEALLRQ
ncbi:MAG: hypothetical protein JWP69_106 [Flaviaesturariibacter sp.]|nr:hypothetical protein [Flaviaesturariibacter sp.]